MIIIEYHAIICGKTIYISRKPLNQNLRRKGLEVHINLKDNNKKQVTLGGCRVILAPCNPSQELLTRLCSFLSLVWEPLSWVAAPGGPTTVHFEQRHVLSPITPRAFSATHASNLDLGPSLLLNLFLSLHSHHYFFLKNFFFF